MRTPPDASSPSERSEQAHELALGKTHTAQGGFTARAGGPGARLLSTFGKHIYDDMEGQDTRQRPHGENQRRERLNLMLSLRHSIGNVSPLETLARGSKSVPHFRCYASPPQLKSAPFANNLGVGNEAIGG
jgi:hypothetical protein